MTFVERVFALKQTPLFDSLEDSELILIAEVTVARQLAAGAIVAEAGSTPNRLTIVAEGAIVGETSGAPIFPVIGIDALVLDRPIEETLVAESPGGAECLLIAKGHFFTLINECPKILTGYLKHTHAD